MLRNLLVCEKDSSKLEALKCAGVDNWGGYGDAMTMLEEWENEGRPAGMFPSTLVE